MASSSRSAVSKRSLAAALAIAVALAAAPAAAQQSGGCPSKQCNSYFSNAGGGPVDCCFHDYSKSDRCAWNGTPVSFRFVRNCEESSVGYTVLTQSNFQGPPGANECRCQTPMANQNAGSGDGSQQQAGGGNGGQQQSGGQQQAGGGGGGGAPYVPQSLQMCTTLVPRDGVDIPGSDIPCNGEAFCKVCGTAEVVRDACAGRGDCVAFTYDPVGRCGFLKAGTAGSKGRGGWVSFMR
ncbi:hypothetical protein Rsub_09358 [Raphidocelis subcapitata]|uniref:Uncharacterized protein n=1 Tax=Raphidocelis subcapitata TaxID=307507 RepID=A0A2V0PCE5_9CHLO|nr:hypothetical protein Rsub_09358 [Raphidocelis subcapitata]|eukprot:GBF96612.1 hypothetical protein Rsub_09358 [Raphidocelis subcapitata]